MKGQNNMRILTGLALTLLTPAAIFAQAPAAPSAATLNMGQKVAAIRPELNKHNEAFEYPEAQAKIEAILPAVKPAFDKSSVNNVHLSTRNYADLCQAYFLAFQAADNMGQWEKGLDYLNKALDLAKENVEAGKGPLAEQRDYYKKKANSYKALIDRNADAIKALHAKAKLEDYEEGTMTQVKGWEKEVAEGEKWAQFFQYDMDLALRNIEDFQKFVSIQDKKIKDQQSDIDTYKGHPGDKLKWVEAVISNKAYLEAYPEKGDKLTLCYRLTVLDPENKKVRKMIDVLMGRATAEPEKPARKKK